ncbi:hypothetical protein BEI46_08595 [Aliivibrio fischeri]|uniref:glycosyltransferase family 2 protein n=1 Tax=Aliivibrio fischeri TaxID=668 RepID=UPI00084CE537|nr:glycosyltransferase [Aliivibrio fischeri]OED56338.1 hypothetical protein BEI46_08595 [Aliivibrio fischeri]
MFSIIIPTYNSSKYIFKALDSILEQNIENNQIEIIIVDDKSDDVNELINVISNYNSDLNIKLILNEEKGNASVSRNIGINKANFDIICLLDADDYWSENKLKSGLEVLSDKVVVYTKLYRGTNEQISHNKHAVLPKKAKENRESLGEYWFENKGITQTSSLMFRKSDFPNVLFNEGLSRHQDYDFCLKLEDENAKFVMDEKSITYWIILNESVNAVNKGANIEFCISWLKDYSKYLTVTSKNHYIGKNMFLISIKENNILKWLRYSFSFGFSRFLKIIKISMKIVCTTLISRCFR